MILVHGKVYAASSGAEVARLFDMAVKDFPREMPTLVYIPPAEGLGLGPR